MHTKKKKSRQIGKTLDHSPRLQFMSLREIGIKKLLQLNIPLDDVMNLAHHWSLEATQTFLIHDTRRSVESIKNSEIDLG